MSRNLVSFKQLAAHFDVSVRTVENWVGKGYFPAYKVPGRRGYMIDAHEASHAIEAMPSTKVKPGTKRFGPNAVIKTLPEVVTKDAK